MSDWSNPLLPSNQTPLEAAIATATEPRVLPEVISTLWDADRCPASLMPWLAWALSVDAWDETWDEATQRRVITASIDIHRKKGTVAAVRTAIASLGYAVRLVEWWQLAPPGIPHTFQVDVEIGNLGMALGMLESIERQIISIKPVRSHFTTRLIGRTKAKLYIGAATVSGEVTEVLPHHLTAADAAPGVLRLGIGWWEHSITTVYPQGA